MYIHAFIGIYANVKKRRSIPFNVMFPFYFIFKTDDELLLKIKIVIKNLATSFSFCCSRLISTFAIVENRCLQWFEPFPWHDFLLRIKSKIWVSMLLPNSVEIPRNWRQEWRVYESIWGNTYNSSDSLSFVHVYHVCLLFGKSEWTRALT